MSVAQALFAFQWHSRVAETLFSKQNYLLIDPAEQGLDQPGKMMIGPRAWPNLIRWPVKWAFTFTFTSASTATHLQLHSNLVKHPKNSSLALTQAIPIASEPPN